MIHGFGRWPLWHGLAINRRYGDATRRERKTRPSKKHAWRNCGKCREVARLGCGGHVERLCTPDFSDSHLVHKTACDSLAGRDWLPAGAEPSGEAKTYKWGARHQTARPLWASTATREEGRKNTSRDDTVHGAHAHWRRGRPRPRLRVGGALPPRLRDPRGARCARPRAACPKAFRDATQPACGTWSMPAPWAAIAASAAGAPRQ